MNTISLIELERASSSYDKAYSDEYRAWKKKTKKSNNRYIDFDRDRELDSFNNFSMQTDEEIIQEVCRSIIITYTSSNTFKFLKFKKLYSDFFTNC